MSDPNSKSRHSFKEAVTTVLEPLSDYYYGILHLSQPKLLGEYILSDQTTTSKVVKFLLGSVVIGSLIETILPTPSSLQLVSLPLINDILILGLWLLGGLLTSAIVYKPLRWLGGHGRFDQTLISSIFVTGAYYPILSLADGLCTKLLDTPLPTGAQAASFAIFWKALAYIHGISGFRSLIAIFIPTMLVAVCAIFVWVTASSSLTSLSADELAVEVKSSILKEWKKNPKLQDAAIEKISLTPLDGKIFSGIVDATANGNPIKLKVRVEYDGTMMKWELSEISP